MRHTLGGGWATDFGPSAELVDNRATTGRDALAIPWLIHAEDITYKLNRGWRKVGGAAIYNSTAIAGTTPASNDCRNLFGFWLNGTSGSPTHKIVVVVNDELHEDNGSGTFTDIASGIRTGGGAVVTGSVFDDFLYVSDSSSGRPIQWDQSTLKTGNATSSAPGGTEWGISVPQLSFTREHKNYLFGAGDTSSPSTLHFSPSLTASSGRGPNGDWLIDGGQIEISPDDGDQIKAMISFRDSLFVFKGPYTGSIWRVTGSQFTDDGSGITDIVLTQFASGIGCMGPNAVFSFGNDIGFIWQNGAIHSLAATERFGDFEAASLSLGLNEGYLRRRVNNASLDKAWCVNDTLANRALFGLPIDASTEVNAILVMDYRFDPPMWSQWPTIAAPGGAHGCNYIVDTNDNNLSVPMIVGSDGFLRKLNRTNRWYENAPSGMTAMRPRVRTPYLSYGSTLTLKSLMSASISARIENQSVLTFEFTRDKSGSQSINIDVSGGNLLGSADPSLEFILGDPVRGTLGGNQVSPIYFDVDEGDEFRQICYEIRNSQVIPDVEVDDFTALIKFSADTLEDL